MNNNKVKGIKAWFIFLPTIIITLILLMSFVVTTVLINKRSEKDASDAHKSSECISLISSLQGRTSSATETISSFVYKPTTEPTVWVDEPVRHPVKFALNNVPLDTFYETMTNQRINQHYIYTTVSKNYDIDNDLLNELKAVEELIDYMDEVQKHAIYLISRMESIDDSNVSGGLNHYLEALGSYTFTPTDLSYTTDEEIQEAALSIIFEKEYSLNKKEISSRINKITDSLRKENARTEEKSDEIVWALRRTLWVLTALIIVILFTFFIILIKMLIKPITNFARNIQENERLEEEKGLYEANYLAKSYNELLDKKNDYESKLTTVAETDPLTGFENRYSYNEFLRSKVDFNHSTCIFMLDINNLKYINDTFGHDKGDELIKNSSLAIKEAFMNETGKNCYRLGGDEFIAIIDNIDPKDINDYLYKFQELQNQYKVNIAVGYAYTSDISLEGYEALMIEADKKMYENKKAMKEKQKEEKK